MTKTPPHPPRQARSRRTLDKLLDAAERLLREKSFQDLSLAALVAEAGVTTGAFYSRFDSKADLLPCLYQSRYLPWLQGVVEKELGERAWMGLEPRERARRAADLLCRLFETRAGLLRAMTVLARLDLESTRPSAAEDDAREPPQHRFLHTLCDRLQAGLDLPTPSGREELEFAVYTAITVARESILFPGLPTARALDLGSRRLRQRLQRLLELALSPKGTAQS